MYNIVIPYFYALYDIPNRESGYHLISTESYYTVTDNIPCYILHPVTYLVYNWKSALLNTLCLFHPILHAPIPSPLANTGF